MLTTSLIRFAVPLSPASSATRALTLPSSQLASSGRDSLHLSTRMGANKQKESAAVTAFRNTYISKSADDVVPKYSSQGFKDSLLAIPAEELPSLVVAVLGKAYGPSGVIAKDKSQKKPLLEVSKEEKLLDYLNQAIEKAEQAHAVSEKAQDDTRTKPVMGVKATIRQQAIGLLNNKLAGQTGFSLEQALGNWNLTLQMVLHGNDLSNEYQAITAQELNLNGAAKKKKNKK